MSEVANAQVAVFPVFQGFRSKVNSEVTGAAKDAGKQFSTTFKGAAQFEVDTSRLNKAVAQATAKLAVARRAQATDAGKVRVAEAQLAEAIEKSGKGSSRAIAAEERLSSAHRNLENSSERTEAAVKDLTQAQERLKKATDKSGAAGNQAASKYASGWKGLESKIGGATSGAFGKAGALAGGAFKVGAAAGIAGLAVLAASAVTGAVDILQNSIAEATESYKVGAITANAVKQTGAAAWTSAQQIGDYSQALSDKIGVDDEAIQSGANLLLTFKKVRNEAGKGNQIFNRATAAAQDLAVTGFGDADSAAKMLGKALNDPVKGMSALGRAGVTFTNGQKDQIKALVKSGKTLQAQKIIMKEVESQVGGAAAASSTAAEKLQVKWSNLQEQMGTALLPAVSALADALGPVLTSAVNGAMPAIQGISDGIQGAIKWFKQTPEVMEGVNAGFSLASDVLGGLAEILGPVLQSAFSVAIRGFAALAKGAAFLLGALGNVPGFGWATEAAQKLDKVAAGADKLAEGIESIGKTRAIANIGVKDEASKKTAKIKSEIKKLQGKLLKMDAKDQASPKAEKIRQKIAKLKGKILDIQAKVRQTGVKSIKVRPTGDGGWKIGSSVFRASGGIVLGPGTGTSDSIPAMLSNREYVLRAKAVQRIGQKTLDYMNRTGQVPAVATSSPVRASGPTIIQGNVYGDYYLNQVNKRDATAKRQQMERAGVLV